MLDKNQKAFFTFVQAGLFPVLGRAKRQSRANGFDTVDWGEVYRLAEEQSVVGLVAVGIEELSAKNCGAVELRAVDVPQVVKLQFVGATLQIDQRNRAMNEFVAKLISLLRENDIYAVLVKGQGIAQCYEKPLWRSSGDVDLLLSDTNYEKAKALLMPLASEVETKYTHFKHLGMTIDGWVVELHGTLHSRLSKRVDRIIDEAQSDVFFGGKVRSVEFKSSQDLRNERAKFETNGSWTSQAAESSARVQVFLPAPEEDVIFVFTHILKHFYIEGIGLRQICDWCRLLWTYRNAIDIRTLELRLRKAGLMTEWKAFYVLAVKYLGMPVETMPLLKFRDESLTFRDSSRVQESKEYKRYKKMADRIMEFVLEAGNFGHNREVKRSRNFFVGKIQAAWRKMRDFARHAHIFPIDSVRFFFHYTLNGLLVAKDMLAERGV